METNARTYLAAVRPVWVVGPTARNGVVQPQAISILKQTAELLKASPIKKYTPTIAQVPGTD